MSVDGSDTLNRNAVTAACDNADVADKSPDSKSGSLDVSAGNFCVTTNLSLYVVDK